MDQKQVELPVMQLHHWINWKQQNYMIDQFNYVNEFEKHYQEWFNTNYN